MEGDKKTKNRAYYLYRHTEIGGNFCPGMVLNPIADEKVLSKLFPEPHILKAIHRYFPDGLNPLGIQVLQTHTKKENDEQQAISEIIFEFIRRVHYPNVPSRLASLYASKSVEEAEQWCRRWKTAFGKDSEQTPESLWEIEYETNAELYDAAWLDVAASEDNLISYPTMIESAHYYWRHKFLQSSFPELLIRYPVTIVRKL